VVAVERGLGGSGGASCAVGCGVGAGPPTTWVCWGFPEVCVESSPCGRLMYAEYLVTRARRRMDREIYKLSRIAHTSVNAKLIFEASSLYMTARSI